MKSKLLLKKIELEAFLSWDFRNWKNENYYIECWSRDHNQPIITQEVVEVFQDKVDWDFVSAWTKISLKFIEKYKKKLNFPIISSRRPEFLTYSFCKKYENLLDWNQVFHAKRYPEKWHREFKDKISFYGLINSQRLSTKFIEENINLIDEEHLWDYLCSHQNLPIWFIKKHENKISLDVLMKSGFKRPLKFWRERLDHSQIGIDDVPYYYRSQLGISGGFKE